MAWLSKRTGMFAVVLLLFTMAFQAPSTFALAESSVTLKSLTLTAYLDGYVQVVHELDVDETYPSVNVSLLGEAQNTLVVDEQDLLLDFSVDNVSAVIDSLGCSSMKISYFTQDLTSKTGQFWTLQAEIPINATVVLPEGASIISLNIVPDLIESSGGQVHLVMPAGLIEVSYVADRSFAVEPVNSDLTWLYIVSLIALAAAAFGSVWYLRGRRKALKTKKAEVGGVDLDKLFEREKDLRPEEVQVVQFLAERNGSAYEAELFERLALPRTTTWRLLKRLEGMEIVEIRKTRRQNIVSIRRKYMKRPIKEAA